MSVYLSRVDESLEDRRSSSFVSSFFPRRLYRVPLPDGSTLELGQRTLVMGIVNVTPDSFADGGLRFDPDVAIAGAEQMVADGADLVDIGAESTRPGADPLPEAEELRRLLPVLEGLRGAIDVPVSVDTYKSSVAERALEASKLRREIKALRERSGEASELIGTSPAMNHLRQLIEKVAPTNSRIMISGPSGSGKEAVARTIHRLSQRSSGPFVVLNAAAITPERMEEELFGTEPNNGAGRRVGALPQEDLPEPGVEDGGFNSIAEVRALFMSDPVLLAGWVHYLAFDLFLGIWIAEQADRIHIHRIIQAPVLAATFLFGPIGLLLHLGLAAGARFRAQTVLP